MNVFRKLTQKIRPKTKKQDSSSTGESATQQEEYHVLGTTAESRKASGLVSSGVYHHGLFVLHPPQEVPNEHHNHSVDIVAVHGLNGKARGTWTDKPSGMLWLEDFLPEEMPEARIMTFGYDSSLTFSQSRGRIEDFARDLLNRLWMLRQSSQNRPLIFVCHSLGGIVAKKALILAHENDHHYRDILASTTGIVFMGTPHQGSDIVNWTSFLTNAVQLVSGNQIVRTNLVKDLSTHSSTLLEISKSFLPRSSGLTIMSFVETQAEPPLQVLVVPTESSRLGLPNEMVFPVNAHHRSICRYPSAKDQTYVLVEAALKAIVSGGDVSPSDADDADMVLVRISGLKPKVSAIERGWDTRSHMFYVRGNMKFSKLGQVIERQAPDLTVPKSFGFNGRSSHISDEWMDCFTLPLRVTNGRPCYKASLGYQINARQSIAAFFSKVFPDPLEAKIRRYPKWMQAGTGLSHSVTVGRDDSSTLQISFLRTVRVQSEKTTISDVPKGLGTFPLFNTQPYREQLPLQAASQGGLMFPMYEKEAMCIAFDCKQGDKFAVRPFLGGINAISGKGLMTDHSNSSRKQDYIIAPDQKRLDGVSVQPGIVKQFVAMKPNPEPKKDKRATSSGANMAAAPETASKGGTVEWQMTGKDEVGGIQLQVIPQFKREIMFAGSMKDASPMKLGGRLESYVPVPGDVVSYDVLRTPKELGLHADETIHIRNLGLKRERDRSKRVTDLTLETPNPADPSDTVELEVFRSPMLEIVASVRSPVSSRDAVLFKVDVDDELKDVQEAAKDIFELPDGILHMPGRVDNNPDVHVPVTDWAHLLFLTEPAASDDEFYRPRTSSHCDTDIRPLSVGPKVDLILVPSAPKPVCHISFLNGAREAFNVTKPLILELPEDTTVASLRKTLASTAGVSTDGIRVASLEHPDLPDDHAIFNQEGVPERYSMPVLALDDGVALLVKTLTGKTVRFHVLAEDTISTVKELIERKEGIPPDQQRLIHVGRQMEDGKSRANQLIFQCATLHLVLRLRGGGFPTITVTLSGAIVFVGHVDDVAHLKTKIFETLGIYVHRQEFALPDDFCLRDKTLTLELKIRPQERVTLGIGAGGSIVQEIVEDKSDPGIWDVGSSKILHVHIVNSHDFRAITGLAPPSTPISWRTYLGLGLPYDMAWGRGDEKGKGVSSDGAFDKLVSLEEGDGFGDDRNVELSRVYNSDDRCDSRRVPSYPLTLLEVDQTVPYFQGLSKKGESVF
ncbi:hypothetical protein B0T10DRAFT_412368 [Thelonectria olida]|uniref:Ubiquitin-like domain-containing protein n=1 Tax=Thelonectria olida TaxID=1576542 RepID=A0A9P8VVH6_9HYPO|nr:hypothetical protein B0T10DRAFT_412368 [Thelonectria olida]